MFRNSHNKIIRFGLALKTVMSWRLKKIKRPGHHSLDKPLIVSLTSFPERFPTLDLTLKCLLNQTVKPDRVILWLSHSDKKRLTSSILNLEKHGLEIKFTETLKSYTKIIPTLKLNLDAYIITVDDDLYYPSNLIEQLVSDARKNPGGVIANRTHVIKFDHLNRPLPYINWEWESYNTNDLTANFMTGVGGVLYPPDIFYKDILNKELFLKLAPSADDIWLYWMIRLNGKVVKCTNNRFPIINWPGSQKKALWKTNVNESANDNQIANMINYYGPLKKINEEPLVKNALTPTEKLKSITPIREE